MSSQSCWSFYTPLHFPFLFLFSLFVSFLDSCPSESKGGKGLFLAGISNSRV